MGKGKIIMTEIQMREIKSGHGDWWGVLHIENNDFILLECGTRHDCDRLIEEMGNPSHLKIVRTYGVTAFIEANNIVPGNVFSVDNKEVKIVKQSDVKDCYVVELLSSGQIIDLNKVFLTDLVR